MSSRGCRHEYSGAYIALGQGEVGEPLKADVVAAVHGREGQRFEFPAAASLYTE